MIKFDFTNLFSAFFR